MGTEKPVIVVGSGKAEWDVALRLCRAGRENVTRVMRKPYLTAPGAHASCVRPTCSVIAQEESSRSRSADGDPGSAV